MKKQMRLFSCVLSILLSACIASAQQAAPSPAGGRARPPADPEARARTLAIGAGDTSPDAMAVLQLERDIESHTVAGDVAWVSSHLVDSFVMVHGDTWVMGKPLMLADTKASYLKRVENKQYLARTISQSKVELHGDVAITTGQYIAENGPGGTPRSWFSVWFERVYEKRNGEWMFVSHRTVHGPTYGPDADSLKDK
jgi:hypothetical protein